METTLPGGSTGQARYFLGTATCPHHRRYLDPALYFRCSLPWPCVLSTIISVQRGSNACLIIPKWIIRSAPGSALTSKQKLLQNKPLALLDFTQTALYKPKTPSGTPGAPGDRPAGKSIQSQDMLSAFYQLEVRPTNLNVLP